MFIFFNNSLNLRVYFACISSVLLRYSFGVPSVLPRYFLGIPPLLLRYPSLKI